MIATPTMLQTQSRILFKKEISKNAPTVVFFGGIHGNEPAGVIALEQVFSSIQENEITGNIIAIKGNLPALKNKKRFIENDLNRLWTRKKIQEIHQKEPAQRTVEETQLVIIYSIIKEIITTYSGPLYFIDIHTTSAETIPFITINDALINRRFSNQFNVPAILGIEEYLEGALLSYINRLGFVSLGFEAGQHNSQTAINNSVVFIKQVLLTAQVLKNNQSLQQKLNQQLIAASGYNTTLYEVKNVYAIKTSEKFTMLEGFKSFQYVKKNTPLAISNNKTIYAPNNLVLFMPLYQPNGKEGFFIIKPIPKFYLWLSVLLRKIKYDNLLVLLPGISWADKRKQALKVNLTVARFMAKQFFHLLGYRNKQVHKNKVYMHNRERAAQTFRYKHTFWYKKIRPVKSGSFKNT